MCGLTRPAKCIRGGQGSLLLHLLGLVEVALHACPTKLVAPVDVGVHAMGITTRQSVAMMMRLYFAAYGPKSKAQKP